MQTRFSLSPNRMQRASFVVVALAGAVTGVLGGVGWRLFLDGARDLAVAMWALAAIAAVALLLLSALARAVASLTERASSDHMAAIRQLESRLERSERELDELRQAITVAAVAEPDGEIERSDGAGAEPDGVPGPSEPAATTVP